MLRTTSGKQKIMTPKESRPPSTAVTPHVRIDLDRLRRQGIPETVFCPGKSTEHLLTIFRTMSEAGQNVMATRATPETAEAIQRAFPESVYHTEARIITLDVAPLPKPQGQISVLCAGTADVPVAEEARITAMRMGAMTHCIYDAGVAGLHRLTSTIDETTNSNAVIVIAGMEGALPSVVGGLIDKPLIAVPTSRGYGWNMEGLSALLGMLNSCAAGVTVVNVDNGYGAGVAAARINRQVVQAQGMCSNE